MGEGRGEGAGGVAPPGFFQRRGAETQRRRGEGIFRSVRWLTALLIAAIGLGAGPVHAAEVLVGMVDGVEIEAFHQQLAVAGYPCSRDLLHGRVHVVPVPAGERVGEVCARIERLPGVRYCEANGEVRAQATFPDDPLFVDAPGIDGQGYLFDLNAPTVWDTTAGSPQVTVAILDSGVDLDHPDLATNIASGGLNITDCPAADLQCAPAQDDDQLQSHGTHVAGIIGAVGDNSTGIAGVNWTVNLLAVKVLSGGSGTVADVAEGIEAAVDAGAGVINASFGVGGATGNGLCDAIGYAQDRGVMVVAAAGNKDDGGTGRDIDGEPEFPASCPDVNLVSVTAYDGGSFNEALFNWGATSVDLAAPGIDILSTGNPDFLALYHTLSGTSQATAMVSGALALLLAEEPDWTVTELRGRLLAAVDKVTTLSTRCATGGRLDLAKLFATPAGDPDGDGVGATDNCPFTHNASQADADGDGVGDACDRSPGSGGGGGDDLDGDGVTDAADNCPQAPNPDQGDCDGDGAGNVCDTTAGCGTNSDDTDGDGVIDEEDNCPLDVNDDQGDCDGDGAGNVCDTTAGCAESGDGGGGCQAAPGGSIGSGVASGGLLLLPVAVVAGWRRWRLHGRGTSSLAPTVAGATHGPESV